MDTPILGKTIQPITNRDPAFLATDISALQAISQAAINVELFTIPLYMNTLYSIHGTHQINAKGISYYKGRQWPGCATSAKPETANAKAFNLIFSVFIQEMLHLQMAANIATAIGIKVPSFTSIALQNPDHGWHCYGKDQSVIPHIVDLRDTKDYKNVRVNLEALNDNQVNLFLAIEQPEDQARAGLAAAGNAQKYFPSVPLAGWTPEKKEADLPLFGTIGWMYDCFAQYISMEYTDGQTLWQKVFDANAVQQDMFNTKVKGHPYMEFPSFDTLFTDEDKQDPMVAFDKAIDMMSAITDQGEGNAIEIQRFRKRKLLKRVEQQYREDKTALEADYPSYSNDGKPAPSADTVARHGNAAQDHFERFAEVKTMLPEVLTWEQWHAQGNRWSAQDLTNAQYDPASAPQNIPKPEEVAGALNRLKEDSKTMWPVLSKVAVGAIAGITTVLDDYWTNQDTQFPYPSMVGSGDRISICWATFGKSPDLALGVGAPDPARLYHACQGMSLDPAHAAASCAAIEVYHTCRGSNGCHAQGGCGFVQLDTGGGSCGALRATAPAMDKTGQVLCGGPSPSGPYSAPSDNKCKTFGGCAVPISASQLFPIATGSKMKLYDFEGPQHHATPIGDMSFQFGEAVYDKAWDAYKAVMKHRGKEAGERPAPTDLRLALPPST